MIYIQTLQPSYVLWWRTAQGRSYNEDEPFVAAQGRSYNEDEPFVVIPSIL